MTENLPPAPVLDESTFKALDALPEAKRSRIKKVAQAATESTAAPPMKLSLKDGTLKITLEGDPTLVQIMQMADIGTNDRDFYWGLIGQITSVGSQGKRVDETNANFVMAVVRSVQPTDALEAMLATQMGAIHSATMMLARRLNTVDTIPQQDSAERALNKLARTFAMQMEALKRYRTGGQQKVVVEHVTVNAGGQAVVGTVTHGGRATDET